MFSIFCLVLFTWSCSGSKDHPKDRQTDLTHTQQVDVPEAHVSFQKSSLPATLESDLEKVVEEISETSALLSSNTPISLNPMSKSEDIILGTTNSQSDTGLKVEGDINLESGKVDSFLKSDEITEKEKQEIQNKVDHQVFSSLLMTYVDEEGKVNYKELLKESAKLNDYLNQLGQNPVHGDWSRNEKLAYWINTYNAFTIKLILDHYPVVSITEIEGGKPWDKKWIILGDQTYSLNQIENEIIRPQFDEPRIHFAVNCAAKSCPPLANKAFTADNLEGLLESRTKEFINNKKYNQLESGHVRISKIFDWYKSDFRDLVAFLNKYSSLELDSGAKIEYTDYDWRLNE